MMKTYKVELPDDDMEVFTAANDNRAVEYCDENHKGYLEIYELDDDYNEIRGI